MRHGRLIITPDGTVEEEESCLNIYFLYVVQINGILITRRFTEAGS